MIRCLGDLAEKDVDWRDQALKANAVRYIMDIIEKSDETQVIRNATCVLSTLVQKKPLPKFELVQEAIPLLFKLIQQTQDLEILSNAAWALFHILDASRKQNSQVNSVYDTNICQDLVAHIKFYSNQT